MRNFRERLPVITDKLPVCGDGTTCSVSFYIFNKEYQEGAEREDLTMEYAYELAYAYRQLMAHTNIADCGRVRIFVASYCLPHIIEYLTQIGLDSLVVELDVELGVNFTGYFKAFAHKSIEPCRYRFNMNADLWWMDFHDVGEKFDWQALCDYLDEHTTDRTIYGEAIEKPEWIYQLGYANFPKTSEEVQPKALENLTKIFGPDIPEPYQKMAFEDHEKLKQENNISELIASSGPFNGIRKGSVAEFYLQKLYKLDGEHVLDDQCFYALLLALHSDLNIYDVLQGGYPKQDNQIRQLSIYDFNEPDTNTNLLDTAMLNVGCSEFFSDDYGPEKEIIHNYYLYDTVGKDTVEITLKPSQKLCSFGKHIIGTYALSSDEKIFSLLTDSDRSHSAFLGYPAAFMPYMSGLPSSREDNRDLAVIYCLSYRQAYFSHDLHVYAKSMIYAYKSLITHTDILDVGNVHFFVDERCMPVVYPYCEKVSIHKLVTPFKSDLDIHYAAYIPQFWAEQTHNTKYKLYFDVDMWWLNLLNSDRFSFADMLKKLDKDDTADIFGNEVPKPREDHICDLKQRCVIGGKDNPHLTRLDAWMQANYGENLSKTVRTISGSNNIIRNSPTLDRLKEFYKETGEFIRDDEAFWGAFLTKNKDVTISPIWQYIPGIADNEEQMIHKPHPGVMHVGTYMFEHFFEHPYAKQLFEHFSEEYKVK